jgi:IclR family acetate operon transcriptional repressor
MKFTKHTRHTITSATAFLAELKQVNKNGYALDRGEESETFACVAAPVFDHRGQPVASIWISGPSDRVTPGSLDKLGAKLKQFAEQLSHRLGHRPAALPCSGEPRLLSRD